MVGVYESLKINSIRQDGELFATLGPRCEMKWLEGFVLEGMSPNWQRTPQCVFLGSPFFFSLQTVPSKQPRLVSCLAVARHLPGCSTGLGDSTPWNPSIWLTSPLFGFGGFEEALGSFENPYFQHVNRKLPRYVPNWLQTNVISTG